MQITHTLTPHTIFYSFFLICPEMASSLYSELFTDMTELMFASGTQYGGGSTGHSKVGGHLRRALKELKGIQRNSKG